MRQTKKKRALSLFLCAALLFSQIGVTTYAEGAEPGGLCEHHPTHTTECGYVEAEPGTPCNHEHTEDCFRLAEKCVHKHTPDCYPEDEDTDDAATPSNAAKGKPTECGHVCSEETGCIREVPACPHEHDDECGYRKATPGHPCGFVCDICNGKDSGTGESISGNDLPAPEEPKPVEGMDNTVTRITDFDVLAAEIQNRLIPAGTDWDALALPAALGASGYTVADDTEPLPETLTVDGVTWEIDPDNVLNDGNSTYSPELGSYCLTPVLPEGYELESGVELPEIYVKIDGQTALLTYDENTYSKNDVAVINAIIDANGLSATKDDPASWTFADWNIETPKRIESLSVSNKNLMGTLDVTGLSSLTALDCGSNQLTVLDVSGLSRLTVLGCYKNQLTGLDVSGLSSLTHLLCDNNQLTALDVSSLTSLTYLTCNNNKLAALDVSDLTNLANLACGSNKLTALDVSDLSCLTILLCDDNQLTALDVSGLTNLTKLGCGSNKLTALDVSSLSSLTDLVCSNTQLTTLDVSGLSRLTYLSCSNTQLMALDVSDLSNLTHLNCLNNPLAFFKLEEGKKLTVERAAGGTVNLTNYIHGSKSVTLRATDENGYTFQKWTASGTTLPADTANPVTFTLDAEITLMPVFSGGSTDPNDTNKDGYHDGDVAVINTIIENNGLSATKDDPASWTFAEWNFETPERIKRLDMTGKDLTGTLNVTSLGSLRQLYCNKNKLTALDVSGLSSLTFLDCNQNNLMALDVSGLSSLTFLYCNQNKLTELNVSGLSSLDSLDCDNNGLTALDVSSLSSLTFLDCNENKLTELNVSGLLSLTFLDCDGNQLTKLDVSGLSSLTHLNCDGNQLTKLDVSGLSSLISLNCYENQLTVLNASGLSSLTNLNCNGNQLTKLDVSGLSSLTHLNCNGNQLTKLDVSGLSSLTHLNCDGNQLTKLDVSGLSSLSSLNCYKNQLTVLNASGLSGLTNLNCDGNQLTKLDVSGLSNLTHLNCQNNPLAFFKLAEGVELTVERVTGGMVNINSYNHNSKSVSLTATAKNDFAFQNWTANGTTLTSPTANPVTFTLDAKITLRPVFFDLNAEKVAVAKSAIEGGTYTMEQATANTQDAVKTELARQINALLGKGYTGVTVTDGNITINSFTAATAGNAGDPDGTGGSFNFTVSLTKGSSTATTSKGGSITATRYKALVITTESLPDGKVGTAYTATLTATSNEPITWSVVSGSLPDGLTLSGATISGTPTKTDSFTFTVKAANGNGPDTEKEFTITISAKGADTTLKTLTVTGATITPAFDPAATGYTATVDNGVSKVTITAKANDDRANVTGDTGEINLNVGENKFIVTVTAENGDHKDYSITIQREAASYTPPSGGNSSGDHDYGGTTSIIPPAPPEPDAPTTGTITPGKPDKSGFVSIPSEQVTNAVNEAVKAAEKGGQAKNGIAVAVNLPTGTTGVTLDRAALDRLIASGVKSFKLDFNGVTLSFDLPALKEIAEKTTGSLTFGVAKATGLTGDALAATGNRPAYNLTVSWQEDGRTAYLDSFGAGSVSVAMAYTPAANELTGSLYAVYANGGKVEWIDKSSYDRNSKTVIFQTGHFSTYGVGYKAPPAFTDTVNHWARADIDFAVSRGLFSGTSETTFTPDSSMTRGMFVTALGRLAGIDPAGYPSSSRFIDVPATAYYAPYVEWAAGQGIVNDTGEKTFAPDRAVTREEMAAIMYRYAEKLRYTLPVTREAENFTDAGQITGSVKDAVQRVQQAGIMNGKGAQRFSPKDTATRAETAAVLRRFVEIVIDPATTGGWTQNDSGAWLYYQNGKPVTGWKQIESRWYYFDTSGIMQAGGWRQIGGKWYYFYHTGIMAVSTKVEGYEVGPDGARKE